MNITISSTPQLTIVDGAAVRVWHGVTERGVRCFVFVRRVAVAADQDLAQFERELTETALPAELDPTPKIVDLRHIL